MKRLFLVLAMAMATPAVQAMVPNETGLKFVVSTLHKSKALLTNAIDRGLQLSIGQKNEAYRLAEQLEWVSELISGPEAQETKQLAKEIRELLSYV